MVSDAGGLELFEFPVVKTSSAEKASTSKQVMSEGILNESQFAGLSSAITAPLMLGSSGTQLSLTASASSSSLAMPQSSQPMPLEDATEELSEDQSTELSSKVRRHACMQERALHELT